MKQVLLMVVAFGFMSGTGAFAGDDHAHKEKGAHSHKNHKCEKCKKDEKNCKCDDKDKKKEDHDHAEDNKDSK